MEDIGRRLRAAREVKGITLETVEEETHIRRKYVEALETGHYSEIPGDAYIKGFLRTYGNYLGLDGPALVEQYKQGRDAPADESHTAASAERNAVGRPAASRPAVPAQHRPAQPAAVRPSAAHTAERPAARPVNPAPAQTHAHAAAQSSTAHRPRPRRAPSQSTLAVRRLMVAVVALAVLGAVGYVVYQAIGGLKAPETTPVVQEPAPPANTQQPEPAAPPPQVPEQPKVTWTKGTGEEVLFAVPGQEITLVIEPSGERVWMQITVDGKLVYDGFPTQNMEFKGGQIKARMGHMNNINLVVNGQRFDKPLKDGPYTLLFNKQ